MSNIDPEELTDMDAEELAVRVADIDDFRLTRPVLRERVEEIAQENLQYRQAFRSYDATDINSPSVSFPVPDDSMGQPKIVEEGAEFPSAQESYSNETLTFDKFGFNAVITHEAREDSMIDVVRHQVDRQARQMAEEMNRQAFETIKNNNLGTYGDNDGVFTYSDVLSAEEELKKRQFSPDLLIVDVGASSDIRQDSNFLEASDMQGEMRRSGQIGRIAGYEVVEANDDNVIVSGSPGGVLIDTDYYGYEATREEITTEEFQNDETQEQVYRIYTRMGWIAIEPNACALIQG